MLAKKRVSLDKQPGNSYKKPHKSPFCEKLTRFQEFYDGFLSRVEYRNPYMRIIDPTATPSVVKNGKKMIMLGSNNYLGLSNHPLVKEEAKKAIDVYGTGACSSRICAGSTSLHYKLENELAEYKGTESALLFPTGYMTMMGTISGLLDENDIVLSDQLNHASIIDGIRLSKAQTRIYEHNDMKSLEESLKTCPSDVNKLIVTDGIFSIKGDIANLPEIKSLAEKYGAFVMVDDAHGSGIMGEKGKGTLEHFHMEGQIDLVCCTFSKVFGALGGFVGAKKEIINFLRFNSRPFLFTASPPPSVMSTVLACLRVMKNHPELLQKLRKNVKYLRENLKNLKFRLFPTETPIIPIIIGEEEKTFRMSIELEEEGVYVNPIIPPGVSAESSLIRVSVMATLSQKDLDTALDKFKLVGKRLRII